MDVTYVVRETDCISASAVKRSEITPASSVVVWSQYVMKSEPKHCNDSSMHWDRLDLTKVCVFRAIDWCPDAK
jgi:hypothetical protein